MAEPPILEGASHDTSAAPRLACALTPPGGLGGPVTKVALDEIEEAEVPPGPMLTTLKV